MGGTGQAAGAAPMEGHGAYNRSSAVQAAGYAPALPLLAEAARQVPVLAEPGPVLIADYGASQGRNSLEPMATAIRTLRGRIGAERPVWVVHTDLPSNDFGSLFQAVATDPASYRQGDPAAFTLAVGRSFYEQILPAGSVTLGWSAWAVQWLSRTPCPIPDHVQVAYSRDEAARAAFAAQAARDWRDFLTHRAAELIPGGRLLVLTMALTDAGEFGYRPVLDAMVATLQALVAAGEVRADEAARMAIPTVGRGREQLLAPFTGGDRLTSLEVEHLGVFQADDPIWRDFAHDHDAAAYGRRWAAFSRASVLPTLAADLAGDAARRQTFMDRMEAGMAERLAAHPQPMLIPLAMIVVARGPA